MADNDVVITVRSRDLSDPEKVRRRWRKAQQDIARDAEQESRRSGTESGKGWLSGFSKGMGDGGVLSKIVGSYTSVFSLSAKTAATAFSAQFIGAVVAGLAQGAAKVAHGAAALFALIPAAVFTGAAALGVFKLAVTGVGDAMEAAVTGSGEDFREAIKGLSPAARSFAREVRGMRSDLVGLKDAVQDRFFDAFAGQTSKLASTWLPLLRRELGGIASSLGGAVDQFATWARQPAVVVMLTAALRNARTVTETFGRTATNLATAFLPLVTVGSSFLPRLSQGLSDASGRFALFMQHAADTGKLAEFISNGLDKLRSLGDTFGQIVRIGRNVVAIFAEFGSFGGILEGLGIEAGGILDALEAMSEKARNFFQTAAGGQAITEIFSILRSVLNATFGTLAHLATIVGRIFAPILPQMSKFGEAVANLQLALADALEPALQALADILATVLPILTSVMNVIADNGPAAAFLAGVLLTMYGAWKLVGIASSIASSSMSAAKMGMVGTAAAAVGLAMALKSATESQEAEDTARLTEKMIALDGAVSDSSRAVMYLARVGGNLDDVMTSLIEQNPRVAQSVIDQADAYGISAEEAAGYQQQLDITIAAQNNMTDAITRTKNALRAQTDPVFAAADASNRLAQAQARVAELEASGTATAAEMAQAHQDVANAALDQQGAMLDLGVALEEGNTSLGDVLAQLKSQVKQGNITRETYNSMASTARTAFGGVTTAINGIPTTHNTRVTASDRASAVAAKVAEKLRRLNGDSATVYINAVVSKAAAKAAGAIGFAHGGIAGAVNGATSDGLTWAGEHGPELLDLPPGTRVHSNPDSMRMAGAADSGGPVVLTWAGGPSDDLGMAIWRWLQQRVQVSYGGDVSRALGG